MDDLKQLSQEEDIIKKGGLPPLFSFIITAGSSIIAFVISFLLVFPGLRSLFGLSVLFALFISLGTFIILSALLGEVITAFMQSERSQEA